jgi:hypothetical protein
MKSHNLTNANSGSETFECCFVPPPYQGKIDPTYETTDEIKYLFASSSSCISIYWLVIKKKIN